MYDRIKLVAKFERKWLNSQNLFCKLYIYLVVDDLSDFSKAHAYESFHCYKQAYCNSLYSAYCLFLISLYFCFRFCSLYIFVCMHFSVNATILVNKNVY